MSEELKILFAERILLGDELIMKICEMIKKGRYECRENNNFLFIPVKQDLTEDDSYYELRPYLWEYGNENRWSFVEMNDTKEFMIAFNIHSKPNKL